MYVSFIQNPETNLIYGFYLLYCVNADDASAKDFKLPYFTGYEKKTKWYELDAVPFNFSPIIFLRFSRNNFLCTFESPSTTTNLYATIKITTDDLRMEFLIHALFNSAVVVQSYPDEPLNYSETIFTDKSNCFSIRGTFSSTPNLTQTGKRLQTLVKLLK